MLSFTGIIGNRNHGKRLPDMTRKNFDDGFPVADPSGFDFHRHPDFFKSGFPGIPIAGDIHLKMDPRHQG